MLTFTKEQIKEITDQLDTGFRVFYHKVSGELIFVPDTDKHYGMEIEAWQDDLDKLDKDFTAYQEIEAMDSRDSFGVMADFAEQVPDSNLRNKLIDALNRKKPFREFKFVIDNSGKYRQSWFDFKNNRYLEWTEDQVKAQQEIEERKNADD